MKIYVAAVEALRKKERGDETQFTTKTGEKLVWVPVISFSVTHLMACYAQTGRSRPPIAWLYRYLSYTKAAKVNQHHGMWSRNTFSLCCSLKCNQCG